MQLLSKTTRRNRQGYALVLTLAFLAVMLIVFVSMMYWITSNSYVTNQNNQFNMSEAAAEGATEKVLSQMNFDYIAQSLSNSASYYATSFLPGSNDMASWPIQYTFSDTNGNPNQITVAFGPWTTNTIPLNSQYAGLYGEVQPCTITATATPIGQRFSTPATVSESLQFATIPLFQFAIFYNMNLEIAAAQTLSISGPVWSNGGLWSGSTTITFANTVSAVGIATNGTDDPFVTYSGSGKSTYSLTGQPTSGNTRLTMPIGTNNDPAAIEALVDLPPANYPMNSAAAYTTNGQYYFANQADLYVTNMATGTNWGGANPKGTNMIVFYSDAANGPLSYLTQVTWDFYLMSNANTHSSTLFSTNNLYTTNGTYWPPLKTNVVWYAGYSFLTNVFFYDWREGWNGGSGINGKGKPVQAVQIDIGLFNIWVTNAIGGKTYNDQCNQNNHKSHPIDSIYVYNAVPPSGTVLPAVRIVDGGMLPYNSAPYGFTVATAMPIYVLGDYNASNNIGSSLNQANSTTYTWPAGLMGDAITILSDSWNDSVTSKKPSASSDTTVNAAVLAGIVQSTNLNSNPMYSGGVENFFRTLETWGTFYWHGAIVVMFPSRYATNYWQQTGNYYGAPTRKWGFDTNFAAQVKLPPMAPQSKGVIRASWAPANH